MGFHHYQGLPGHTSQGAGTIGVTGCMLTMVSPRPFSQSGRGNDLPSRLVGFSAPVQPILGHRPGAFARLRYWQTLQFPPFRPQAA